MNCFKSFSVCTVLLPFVGYVLYSSFVEPLISSHFPNSEKYDIVSHSVSEWNGGSIPHNVFPKKLTIKPISTNFSWSYFIYHLLVIEKWLYVQTRRIRTSVSFVTTTTSWPDRIVCSISRVSASS